MTAIPDAKSILYSVFGYDKFRGDQETIISQVVSGGDALVLMPTGGGKSLCFQIPALLRSGVGIVVSPLIALMQDQVDTLLQQGVRAAFLNSTLDGRTAWSIQQQARAGQLDLLYVAPERLLTNHFLAFLKEIPLALFAIDEAHCVSQWGHDFRPEYLQLSLLHQHFPGVPRIALTATADTPTRNDILNRLDIQDAVSFVSSFDRPNLCYQVVPKKNARSQLLSFLQAEHAEDAGIIYCLSRKKVDGTARWLTGQGWKALPYHAGMDQHARRRNQERFIREEGVVIVATVAFGMGIDKPNVRFVAHLDLPKSLESYYQETGRSGRDGLPANVWLAYGLGDVVALRQMLGSSEAPEQQKRIEQRKLDAMLGYCETTSCRRQVLLRYFGEELPTACGNCDTCLHPVATWDGTVAAQKAMSCVYRTGQKFGVTYLTDILLGKDNSRIRSFGHQSISTFGIGQDIELSLWRIVFRQLVAAGLLEVDVEGYGGLRLTEKSRPVLRGEQTLYFRKDASPSKATKRAASGATDFDDPAVQKLWQKLRKTRLALSKEQGVPPYVIFHDSTLREMANSLPRNLAEMGSIPGIGATKLARYGKVFLAIFQE